MMEYFSGVLRRIMQKKVLKELHDEPIDGHFGGDTMTHKILRVGYF